VSAAEHSWTSAAAAHAGGGGAAVLASLGSRWGRAADASARAARLPAVTSAPGGAAALASLGPRRGRAADESACAARSPATAPAKGEQRPLLRSARGRRRRHGGEATALALFGSIRRRATDASARAASSPAVAPARGGAAALALLGSQKDCAPPWEPHC
jgi:hypothetical protein